MVGAAELGRRIAAVVPLTIIAVALLLVVLIAVLRPTPSRRAITLRVLQELTQFAYVVAGHGRSDDSNGQSDGREIETSRRARARARAVPT